MNGTIRAMSLWREKFEGLSKEEQFKNLALTYYGAPYEWGHEIALGTDCSGLICGPLILMGHEVRITADQLLKTCTSQTFVENVFFMYNQEKKAHHCGIILDKGACIHASGKRGVVIESIESVKNEYSTSMMLKRSIDWAKVEASRGIVYDLDTDLH